MEFSVPTNWQKGITSILISENRTGEITEVYGKLLMDAVGGGRPASTLAFVSERAAREHIAGLRQKGFRFNYLLNALCMDNMEFTRRGKKNIMRLLERLSGMNVDSFTVANPYLARLIRKEYPSIAINASVMANIDSVDSVKFWEGLGVSKITFSSHIVNRNFSLIRVLRKALKCKMQLIANCACLCDCPTRVNHSLLLSHSSQKWHSGYNLDYYLLMCRYKRFQEPVNFIRADWIRPEDIAFYEGLGVDSIKLVDRRLPTEAILRIISAYIKRRYDGNLVDLLPALQTTSFTGHKGWIRKIFYLGLPWSLNPVKVLRLSKLLSKVEVVIDNRQLDGFLSNIPEGCGFGSCDSCGYCKKTAVLAVKIDGKYLEEMLVKYRDALQFLIEK